jgi:hypothetical protein
MYVEGGALRSEIHKPINSNWNKDELSQQWKNSSNVPIYQNGNKTDTHFSNYSGISLLSTSTKCYTRLFSQG